MFGFQYLARAFSQRLMVRASALSLCAVAATALSGWPSTDAGAKGPGRTYCFLNTCHRVKTIAETQAIIGQDLTLVASYYDSCARDRFNPCGLTSSGERFRPEAADNAASPMFPDGTILLVWSPMNRQAVVVRINNAGPYWGDRRLDLSRAAARKLGLGGVGKVKVRVLKAPTKRESIYSAHRNYEAVPGPIGSHASLDAAHGSLVTLAAAGGPGSGAIRLAMNSAPVRATPAAGLAAALKAEQEMHAADRAAAPEPVRVVTAKAIEWPVVYDMAKPVWPKLARVAAVAKTSVAPVRTTTAVVRTPDRVQLAAVTAPVVKLVNKPVNAAVVVSVKQKARVKDEGRRDGVSNPAKKARADLAALVKTELSKPAAAERAIARAGHKSLAGKPVADKSLKSGKPTKVAAAKATKTVAKVWAKPHVAEAPVHHEIKTGHTTYAEKHHRWPQKSASLAKPKAVTSPVAKAAPKAVAAPAPIANATSSKAPVKKASLEKAKKAAALRKVGTLQTSELRDRWSVTPPSHGLTGASPRLPAGVLEEMIAPARPNGIRVRPSALV